ncbi:GNAT family N-acetyltransferase [Mycetocola tolaasinivorans]|uniref:GNAT family N-acetyltransferase n=1 Tax=Mycetocola tolaasinivorans TaxID=76635 RepID=A0A3L7AAV6_9MICO|nr:GNAT family N-acetyltransferase [Mycetocola tolaasinivorans]RLP77337.1 GNAT family N-acetyltransferase [Mycetocola tolaasinivorans]
MTDLRLEELSATTIVAVNALTLKPGQEQFIAPVSYSVAAAVTDPSTTWQRVVLRDDKVVGFVQASFDENSPSEEFRSILWRINVDAGAQGGGVGTFAVDALTEEARKRGFDHVTVIYEPGDLGPDVFFRQVGFVAVGETAYGEVLARRTI